MTADEPTILATSGGVAPSRRLRWEVGPLTDHAVELSGVTGRAPKVCFVPTAMGDSSDLLRSFYEAANARGFQPSHLSLFPMPNVDDMAELLLGQDVIWVWGGSVAGLLAMWKLHGVDELMRRAWRAGVVLTGVSAGSICWHTGGTTDSFGPELRAVTNGLGLVPFSNGVHYDSEAQRRPLLHQLLVEHTLPPLAYATDDHVGIWYEGTEATMVVGDREFDPDGPAAYRVELVDGEVLETRVNVGSNFV